MKMRFKFTLSVLLILTFSACGGGGGGGGGGGSKSSASTGVRILHAVIDAAPADIISSAKPGEVVTTGYFSESTFYGGVPTGDQTLSLTLHNNPAVIHGTSQFSVEKNHHYSLLFYGDEFQIGFRTSIISDNPGEIPEGYAAVKIIHGLVGASMLNAVFTGGQTADGIQFGGASEYFNLPAGPATIKIRRASDGLLVSSVTSDFAAGKAYSIFAAGEIEYYSVTRILED
jgi:hypothetical protein